MWMWRGWAGLWGVVRGWYQLMVVLGRCDELGWDWGGDEGGGLVG